MDEMARRQFENISLSDNAGGSSGRPNNQNHRRFDTGPLMKLSVQLIHTYRQINDQYYKSRQKWVGFYKCSEVFDLWNLIENSTISQQN